MKYKIYDTKSEKFRDDLFVGQDEGVYLHDENGTTEIEGCKVLLAIGVDDTNGKEMYNGDIVTFHKGYVDDTWTDSEQGKPYEIKWDNDSLGYRAVRGNKAVMPNAGQRGDYKWTWNVIGNIFQNPELLNP